MHSSNKIVSFLSRFIQVYLLILAATIIFSLIAFAFYFDYTSSVAKTVSHNAIMANDRFQLKQNLAPLVRGVIIGIKILDYKEHILFNHATAVDSSISVEIPKCHYDKSTKVYCINLKFDGKPILLFWLFSALIFIFLSVPMFKSEKKKYKNKLNEEIANMSKKLAHDIRSPLSTLNLITETIGNDEAKQLQTAVIKQINNIAENLLTYSKLSAVINSESTSLIRSQPSFQKEQSFALFFLSLKKEYHLKRHLTLRNIEFKIDENLNFVSAKNEKVIYPIICNLITNSIEATKPYSGSVFVECTIEHGKLKISIEDNGTGIPSQVLEVLGKVEISTKVNTGTHSGNGIGLLNANKDLSRIGGSLDVVSKLNVFTRITITVPI